MSDFIQQLIQSGPVVTDGAWGTELQALGLPIGECPDSWNLTHPEKVEIVPKAYVDAGSRVILTNTFGANRIRLAEFGMADNTVAINKAGAQISRQAAGDKALVFASIGPTGKMLMMGQVTEEELRAAFTEQAQALADGGAHGLVIETMSDPDEARIAIQSAKTTGLPIVGCMTFDTGKERDRTMMGTTPEQSAQCLTDAGADVIGANCGQGIEGYIKICRRLHAASGKPIWIKANAGLPEMKDGKVIYRTTPQDFVSLVPQLIEAGANFIGGCCGTSPEFIRLVCAQLKQY